MIYQKMWIDILELAGGADLGQRFRSHLDVKALRALNFLPRNLNGRILSQRG